MKITISTHNGSKVSLLHNRRDPETVKRENEKWAKTHPGQLRIDPNGHMEIWKDGSLKQAYDELFGEAVEKWNRKCEKNGHPERCIRNYLTEICAKEKTFKGAKHPLYEIIYTVGNKENPVEENTAYAILKEMVEGFEKRNPHLYLLAAYLHGDENGSMHVHCTYIPYATQQSRGLEVQNNLSAALKQQGFVSDSWGSTAQMKWERNENDCLESICRRYGFEVEHPMRGTKQEHLTVEEYKAQKELETTQEKLEKLKELPAGMMMVSKGRLMQLEEKEKMYDGSIEKIEQAKRDLRAASNAMQAYTKAYAQLQKDKEQFDNKVNQAANEKLKMLKDKALEFIKSVGLWEKFVAWSHRAMEAAKESFHR